ncbi:glycosyl transferase family 1 [Rathayibacter caricis DSM 15933]|uniref:Glycosyl transferase family 1 n=1 Tax=Rathayibacter caricis DSM 15933 TaxID=1328867 RepID=A0A2T4USN0_9MICO|nr:glycosyltransferase [Rathayibacter caricis]PTL72516.1 glycosyl transferase family 1 [Rathayibacter caricis DSM 15933]
MDHPLSSATIGLLSTFPPTRCGLATFSQSLATALVESHGASIRTVRVMDELAVPGSAAPGRGQEVVAELVAGDPCSIAAAARALSRSEVVVIQHEYGIYGGPDGSEVIEVLEQLTVPAIVVLHTVLETPSPTQRLVLERVAALADAVVVMTAVAAEILERCYDVDPHRVGVIAHGVPVWSGATAASSRPERPRIITWGLIGPGKGIEWGIRAIAELRAAGVPASYTVHGQTHPKVLASHGEAYRESLAELVTELGLEDDVLLDGRYLDPGELAAAVAEADAVLLPYDSRNQVTSGVLVEALSAGKPVVATAFPHALELLGGPQGRAVAHQDPEAMARALDEVLAATGGAAPIAPTALSWPDAAGRYLDLIRRLRVERAA